MCQSKRGDSKVYSRSSIPSLSHSAQWEEGVNSELLAISHKNSKDSIYGIVISSYELILPKAPLEKVLKKIKSVLQRSDVTKIYFEIQKPSEKSDISQWLTDFSILADWIQDSSKDTQGKLGIKIRCGGRAPLTLDELSFLILCASQRGVIVKFTQGLHQAVSQFDKEPYHLGFINLYYALSLAYLSDSLSFRVDKDRLVECLKDQEVCQRSLLTLSQIESAKEKHQATFGSCSLEEPAVSMATYFE